MAEVFQTLAYLLFRHVAYASHESEILLRSKKIDEEALVDVCSRISFPLLAFRRRERQRCVRIAVFGHVECHVHTSLVGVCKVEQQAEERGLARSVVAHKSYYLVSGRFELVYVDGNGLAEGLLQIVDVYFHYAVFVKYEIYESSGL